MFGKTIQRLLFSLIILLSLAVLSIANSPALAEEIDDYISRYQPVIETLHGLQVTENDVTIIVTSSGCTKKQDFVVVSDKSQPTTATFIRLIPDFCKATSRPYPIKFSLEEVGANEFKVNNTLDPMPRWY